MAVHATAAKAQAAARKKSPATVPANPSRFVAGRLGFGTVGGAGSAQSKASDADAWFADQLAQGRQYTGYAGVAGLSDAFPCLVLDPPSTRQWLRTTMNNEWVLEATYQLEQATLLLQALSPAQLYEATVDFFSNVLNVANRAVNTWCARADYDRTVIRANAFGTYTDMLLASAKHPAMLIYLDNAYSFKDGINENYGRELLELHTVGSAAGYTQAEVVDSARIMTGRLVDFSKTTYVYNINQRWTGAVSVLGFSDPNTDVRAGEALGDRYVRFLAAHPATAQNLARRMCQRFVSDNPSSALVNAVAQAYLDNGTAIVPMLQTIVRSDEFWSAGGAKLRRPYENVVATVRAVGARPTGDLKAAGVALSNLAGVVGQRPLAWSPPNGYPDVATAWQAAGTIVEQWRFQRDLLSGVYAATFSAPSAQSLAGGGHSGTVTDALNALASSLIGRSLLDGETAALLGYLGESGDTPAAQSALFAGAAADVAALVLHSAAHAQR